MSLLFSFYSCFQKVCALVTSLRAILMAQTIKNPPAMQETQVQCMGWEDSLRKGMATHSSILAWRITWTEEPGRHSQWGCKLSDTGEWRNTTSLSVYFSWLYLLLSLSNGRTEAKGNENKSSADQRRRFLSQIFVIPIAVTVVPTTIIIELFSRQVKRKCWQFS